MECSDPRCPYHGQLRVRKGRRRGRVRNISGDKTVAVEIPTVKKVGKYKRYARYTSVILAHLPPCVEVKPGDEVILGATRRLSKRKNWVVLSKVGETK